jgi:NADPH-dependent 2,4-dienoyl-CoA reductase/sulfur reductase-like enzyme
MTAASVGGGTAAPVGARGVAPAAAPARPRVVIVGAGFGGLAAAKGLAGVDVDVLLIDVNNFHTFQPLLYQVATAGLNADDVAYPVRGTFRRQRNVSVLVGRVTDVDLDGRAVVVDGDRRVGYDTLVVAAGAVSATYGVPGVEQHAVPFKTLADARAVRPPPSRPGSRWTPTPPPSPSSAVGRRASSLPAGSSSCSTTCSLATSGASACAARAWC